MILKICILFIILMTYNQLYAQIGIQNNNIKQRITPDLFITCSYKIKNASDDEQENQKDCCLKSFLVRDSVNIIVILTNYSQNFKKKEGKLSVKIYYGLSNSTSSCTWCEYNQNQNYKNSMSYSTDTTITENVSTTDFEKAKIFNPFEVKYEDAGTELKFNKIKLPYKQHDNYFRSKNLFINRIYIEVKVKGLGHKAITYQHIIPVEVTH